MRKRTDNKTPILPGTQGMIYLSDNPITVRYEKRIRDVRMIPEL